MHIVFDVRGGTLVGTSLSYCVEAFRMCRERQEKKERRMRLSRSRADVVLFKIVSYSNRLCTSPYTTHECATDKRKVEKHAKYAN